MFKKLCKLILPLLCLCLIGCGAEEHPNAGLYICTDIQSADVHMRPDELFEGSISLKLISGGKGEIDLGGEGGSVRWSLEGEKLTLDINGEISQGSFDGDRLSIELYESGVVLHFAREGSEALIASAPASDVQQLSGAWYGWWEIKNAIGQWDAYEGMWYDLCAELSFEENGEGRIKLWDEDYSRDDPMALVYLRLDAEGRALSTGGYFMKNEVGEDEWVLESGVSDFESTLCLSGSYRDEVGGFEYELMLRPWGLVWDDVEEAAPDLLPYYYDWYLDLVGTDAPMPDRIEAPALSGEKGE